MTKQEAWLKAGRAFKEVKNNRFNVHGVCSAFYRTTGSTYAYSLLDMMMPVDDYFNTPCRGDEEHTENNDDIRSLFCCLMAQLTDEEYEELLK